MPDPGTPITPQAATAQPSDVAYRCAAYRQQIEHWETCNDVYEGTAAIRRRRHLYLPRNPGEDDEKYERRVKRSRFYNLFEPTLHGLVGLIFRKPPALKDGAGPQITAAIENIDGRGTALPVFSRELTESAVKLGHAGILVDAPQAPQLNRKPTIADQKALKRLPNWVLIQADQVINWRPAVDETGRVYLSLLVIEQCSTEPDQAFGEKEIYRWRVFRCDGATVSWEIWEATGRDQTKAMITSGSVANVTDIPFSPLYAGPREDWLKTKPPLLSLAETNLDLFAVQVDHRYSLHVANTPIPIFKGRKKTPTQKLGAETGVDLELDPNSTAFYLEHKGVALGASRQEQIDLVQRATIFGLQMLAPETRAVETAQSKIIDQAEKNSRLAVIARAVQDCLERALQFHARMIGEDAASITINLDISGLTLDAATIAAYSAMVVARQLTPRTLWAILQEGGALPEDFNADDEEQALAELDALDAASEPDTPPNPNADPANPSPADDPGGDPVPPRKKKSAPARTALPVAA